MQPADSKRSAIRAEVSRLAAIAMLCVGLPTVGLAQSAQPKDQKEQKEAKEPIEQVVVTGSRVKRPEYEGNIPGVQASAEQIELRNFNSAIDILQDIPLVGNGANPNGTNGGQPSSIGAAFVDLLDLGTSRTLTLINGRRAVGNNAGTLFVFGNETGSQVDVNIIPTDLVQRVDVLTVGGAVAYGSDAIAGVVNYVMKDDFEGMKFATRVGQTERGDGTEMAFRSTIGTNFADGRGNVFAHAEFNQIDGLQANSRGFRRDNGGALTGFASGSARNPNFMPAIIDVAGRNNGAFLNAANDGIPGMVNLPELSAANVSPGGVIFNVLSPATLNLSGIGGAPGATGLIGPIAQTFTVNNTQLIPGTPGACNPGRTGANPAFCAFAPAAAGALPNGITPAQVFSAFGVTPPAGLTTPQSVLLAFNVLQANRPTAREFFAQNPNTPLNAFLGSFIPAFPDVANPDPKTNGVLPRVAVPLRFRNDGTIEQFNVATLMPDTPSTLGGASGGDGFNPIFNTPLRVEQDRAIAYFGGHYDLTDNLRFFSENSYAKVDSKSLRGNASANNANSQTIETAALIVNVNNPFLTDANRAALAAAGITDNFVLSRTNQDIQGDNRIQGETKSFRTVQGLEGDFELLDRSVDWDVSFIYGRSESKGETRSIKDVEFALAIDTVRDPATGNIVCRSKLNRLQALNGVPPGVSENIIRPTGPDGLPTEQIFLPVATADIIDACVPLNPFGFNQMSAAARDYVLGRLKTRNVSEQFATQANFSFPIVDLPAGELGFGGFFEYRKEEIDYSTNQLASLGRTRTAALAGTQGETETTEIGAELRVPIFGGEWRFPGLWALDIGGGVRRTTQDGEAPSYRALPRPGQMMGDIVRQESNGDPQNITTLNFNWSPIESLRIRGERTRAIRQPNVVELFLGGQPAFNQPTDPCSNNNISGGPNPATRRANCIQAVINAGLPGINDAATAGAFLQGFTARNVSLQGTFTGNPNLQPEKADSWTAGLVFTPTFFKGFRASADYISIDLADQIFPTNQTQALNFCFDGPQFPDNSSSFGINTCTQTRREPDTFQLTNGFSLGFLNLSATELRALNSTIEYTFGLSDLFNSGGNLGTLSLDLNYYHLFAYRESGTGNFDDTQETQGSVARPRNESRLSVGYLNGPWTVQATWQYTDHTKVFNGGAPANADAFQVIELPSYDIYDVSASYKLNNTWRANFTVLNALDKNVIGQNGANIAFVDQIGRRFALTVTADFK